MLVQLLIPATLVSTAIGQMFAPRIAAEDARGDRQALGTMLKRVTHWNTAVSLPFFATLALLAGSLLAIFTGGVHGREPPLSRFSPSGNLRTRPQARSGRC